MGQTFKDFFKHMGIDVNALKEEMKSESIQNTKKRKAKSIKKKYNTNLFKSF